MQDVAYDFAKTDRWKKLGNTVVGGQALNSMVKV